MKLADVQSLRDNRNLPIDKVGVKNLRYPITLLDRTKKRQHTIATVNMYVLLPSDFKGTHMSRFIEVLNENRECIDIRKIGKILKQMREKLNARKSYIEFDFPYFIEKEAPVTKIKSLMSYDCKVEAFGDSHTEELFLNVEVPITSLCPCSKEISSYGAHNQRGVARIRAQLAEFVWIEELVEVAESSASCEIYSLLKRPDEKFVTEKAYNNPMFVEDIARNITLELSKDKRIPHFSVEVENFESIHNHNAYAFINR
ncbi:GTP cyclohydrolase FolE2 [Hippea maritima]|uniref:GTP cyclohydrolase FolE2 n=1 Tax=Hippea maritima (strain ATCC 700847 / DSM 10411 / MH2) TaxID=760142 RepID=F2LY46_HIPMA|nr:GTP cyclohydrolase FolE2 [Hippea maritima]AEA34369.1 protein of unknown function DUF198 [Hippea maritima DSM 10411]